MEALPPYEVLMPLAPWEEPSVLAQALDTLVQQQPPAQRLVLSVDGLLPPELRAVVERHWSLPVELLSGPGSEGVGLVLARGLAACRCELILRADADDLSLTDRAARQLRWMIEHPAVVAASGWIDEFEGTPENVVGRRVVPTGKSVQSWALWRNPINHPAVVLRRSAIVNVGGYRDQPGFEDYDLWLRLLHHFGPDSVDNTPEVIVHARVGSAHLMRRRGFSYLKAEVRFLWRCGEESLFKWHHVLTLIAIRSPWRLLPSSVMSILMKALHS